MDYVDYWGVGARAKGSLAPLKNYGWGGGAGPPVPTPMYQYLNQAHEIFRNMQFSLPNPSQKSRFILSLFYIQRNMVLNMTSAEL